MRVRDSSSGVTVQAIAGTYVVLLGMDLTPALAKKCLGFSIERIDHRSGDTYFMWNDLLFPDDAATVKAVSDAGGTPDRRLFESDRNPFQQFLRGDYTVSPGQSYTYRVIAQGGTLGALTPLAEVTVDVDTEPETAADGHAVWFNRAATTSQRYATEFGNRRPEDVPDRAAYIWLSRGLEEALLWFIGLAKNGQWGLRGSIYEFQYPAALDALRGAHQGGADVHVLFDDTTTTGSPKAKNEAAVKAERIKSITGPRSVGSTIKHNKFLVLLNKAKPVAVWTGSTNWTDAGIFGHANVGHAFWDATIAGDYLDYWNQLVGDPDAKTLKPWDATNTPIPNESDTSVWPPVGVHTAYSPRPDDSLLDWYADLIRNTDEGVFLSAPFGISGGIKTVLAEHADKLRYVLVDDENTTTVALSVRDGHPENQITGGAYIPEQVGRWLKEITSKQAGLTKKVVYIHTKVLLLNPLTDDPVVISGSANFSPNSMHSSDENMLIIRGNTRVADIYLSEYMRIFNQYRFRARFKLKEGDPTPDPAAGTTPDQALQTTPAWATPYYDKTDLGRFQERLLFSGSPLT